jgi:hypothetical protein
VGGARRVGRDLVHDRRERLVDRRQDACPRPGRGDRTVEPEDLGGAGAPATDVEAQRRRLAAACPADPARDERPPDGRGQPDAAQEHADVRARERDGLVAERAHHGQRLQQLGALDPV